MKRRLLGLAAAAMVAGGVWIGLQGSPASTFRQPYAAPRAELPPPAPALGAGEKVTFLELGSVGCAACEAMQPVLQAVRETFPDEVEVSFQDVRKRPSVAAEYDVRLIPTQVFLLPDGTEYFRHEGYLAQDDAMAVLARMGVR